MTRTGLIYVWGSGVAFALAVIYFRFQDWPGLAITSGSSVLLLLGAFERRLTVVPPAPQSPFPDIGEPE